MMEQSSRVRYEFLSSAYDVRGLVSERLFPQCE